MTYAVLSLSVLASVATSPCPYVMSIQRLVSDGDTLYAGASWTSAQSAYTSRDQGRSWRLEKEIPEKIIQSISRTAPLPLILCDPASPKSCYRIDGQPRVEESHDGGQTWRIAWAIPAERESYMLRAAGGGALMGCGKTPDLHTFDMIFQPGEQPALMIAMGNEGFLVHFPGQGWERTGMTVIDVTNQMTKSLDPTPFSADSYALASKNTQLEMLLAILAGYLSFLAFSLSAWIYAAIHPSPLAPHTSRWIFKPALVILGWILLLVVAWVAFNSGLFPRAVENFINGLVAVGAVLLPLAVLVVSAEIWRRVGVLTGRPKELYPLAGLALLLAGVLFGAAWGCFLLWALDVIATYELALALSIVFGLSTLAGGVTWMLHLMRRAVK